MSTTTASPKVSRGLLVTLGVVGGLGVLALLYLYVVQPLLSGEEQAADPVAAASPGATPEASPGPTGEDADGQANGHANGQADTDPVPETFEVFTARDPFQQLVVVPASGAAGQTNPSPSPTDTASPSPTGTPPPSASVGATTVRLVDVFTAADGTRKILVTVNGTGYEVAEGETFAQRFRVLDISGDCATLLFGDSRFTLCKGEELRK